MYIVHVIGTQCLSCVHSACYVCTVAVMCAQPQLWAYSACYWYSMRVTDTQSVMGICYENTVGCLLWVHSAVIGMQCTLWVHSACNGYTVYVMGTQCLLCVHSRCYGHTVPTIGTQCMYLIHTLLLVCSACYWNKVPVIGKQCVMGIQCLPLVLNACN